MTYFYHIMIIPKKDMDSKRIEKKFDLALDWFRFNSTCWIVYSSKDAETWYSRLKEFVNPGGKLFVCRLDPSDRQGWLPKPFWDWLKEKEHSASEAETQ